MIVGETVLVRVPRLVGTDDFGNEVWETGTSGASTWGQARESDWLAIAASAWSALLDAWDDLAHGAWGEALAMTWGGVATSVDGAPIVVDNVLVNPSSTTYDRIEAGRPHGFECGLTLYMPRELDMDLRGATIVVRGDDYRVVGDPERYTDAALPLGCLWNLVVKVVRHDV